MQLSRYKKEIFGVVLGALVTAVLSLTVGLYNLNKSFQFTLKKDLLYGLRTDIVLLKNVEREIDENLNLLLNHDYRIKIETEELKPPPFRADDKKDKENAKEAEAFINYYLQATGRMFKVTEKQSPSEKFLVDAWQPSGPTVSNIDFELIQMLNDLYRKLIRINKFIDGAREISKGMTLFESQVNTAKDSVPRYNEMVTKISQKELLSLKNRITQELSKLQKERDKIVF